MGMSASQARFLSLTARKNNVEFEGQQINQQRTCLSNESASYYSELCNMQVPTPPSIDDYTKVTYTFNDGAMTNTLISLLPKTGTANQYVVNYLEQWQDDFAIVQAPSSLVEKVTEKNGNISYRIGASELRELGNSNINTITISGNNYVVKKDSTGYYVEETKTVNSLVECTQDEINSFEYYTYDSATDSAKQIYKGTDGKFYSDDKFTQITNYAENDLIICLYDATQTDPDKAVLLVDIDEETGKYVRESFQDQTVKNYLTDEQIATVAFSNDSYLKELSSDDLEKLLKNEQYYLNLLEDKFGESNWYVRYVKNSTTGAYESYFYSGNDLKSSDKYNNKNFGNIACYSLGSTTQTKEVLHKDAIIEKDASGRYVSITIIVQDEQTDEEGNVTPKVTRSYNLTTTTNTDEEAYNDAVNQYKYKQNEYDHKVQQINSKLEIVQQQDKQLELKLKQLDTEENAISTEIDAVKKVISKNVDSSFKTFSA